MKHKIMLLLVFAAMLAGCTKDDLIDAVDQHQNLSEEIRICVNMPSNDASSRIGYTDLVFKWENNDKLMLVGFDNQNKYLGTSILAIDKFVSDRNAYFTGSSVGGASKYDIYYKSGNDSGLTLDASGKVSMNYNYHSYGNHQFPRNVFMKAGDVTLKDFEKTINLKLLSSILCLKTVSNPFVETGAFNVAITLNKGTDQEHLFELTDVQDYNFNADSKLYIPFDPTNVKVLPNSTICGEFTGNVFKYTSVNQSTNGCVYEPGQQYTIELKKDDSDGRRSSSFYDWKTQQARPGILFEINGTDPSAGLSGACRYLSGNEWFLPTNNDIIPSSFSGSNVTKVTIPAHFTTTEYRAFQNCKELKSVIFEAGSQLESLAGYAFDGCSQLAEITLPNGLTDIGESCFAGTAIKTIVIPETVDGIGSLAFENTGLKKITLPPITEQNKNKFTYVCLSNTVLEEVILHENTTVIPSRFFSKKPNLTSITIPQKVTTIEDNVFLGTPLTNFIIPENSELTSIGGQAFTGAKITELILPSKMETIGEYAFDNCDQLKVIKIPASVTTIGDFCFRGCTAITDLYVYTKEKYQNQKRILGDYPQGAILHLSEFWKDKNDTPLPSSEKWISEFIFYDLP